MGYGHGKGRALDHEHVLCPQQFYSGPRPFRAIEQWQTLELGGNMMLSAHPDVQVEVFWSNLAVHMEPAVPRSWPMRRTEEPVRLLACPSGKIATFTVVDDTDCATLENVRPMYDLLSSLGILTTKTVWVRRSRSPIDPADAGDTLEREEYLVFIKELQRRGFEIALHTVGPGGSTRDETLRGYEVFRELFGKYPKMNIMHCRNKENVYWGMSEWRLHKCRRTFLTPWLERTYTAYLALRHGGRRASESCFVGHVPSSPYFWGDVCRERTQYVRASLITWHINTVGVFPDMPFHDPEKPYVNLWFCSSDGQDMQAFSGLLCESNVRRLTRERGVCIVYTHLGKPGFVDQKGNVNPLVADALRRVAAQRGFWFAPASEVLDRLLLIRNVKVLGNRRLFALVNENSTAVEGLTVLADPDEEFGSLGGTTCQLTRGLTGIVLDRIPSGGTVVLHRKAPEEGSRSGSWYPVPGLRSSLDALRQDLRRIRWKAAERLNGMVPSKLRRLWRRGD